jgi:hypothetical protein
MITPFEVPYEFHVRRDGVILVKAAQVKLVSGKLKMIPRVVRTFEDADGCSMVDLWKNKKYRQYVHRLVAEKYLPNPEGYEHVLFKDGNVKNCNVDNLEWCQ